MLIGRSAGLSEDKLAHLTDDPLPTEVFDAREVALVRYARASARNDVITDELYAGLAAHFSPATMVQICFVVGLAGLTNRFHRTFLTEVDPLTGQALAPACPVALPPVPG